MTPNCHTFFTKKIQKSVTIWEHVPKITIFGLQCVSLKCPTFFSKKNVGKVGHFGNIYPKGTIFGL